MGIRLYSFGGVTDVTGTRHFLETDSARIMIDCGAFQGHGEESARRNSEWERDSERADAVVLTHAHYDHSGLLPVLSKRGYRGSIYSTPATRDLAGLILMDSAKIQERDYDYLSRHAQGKTFIPAPLYSGKDVINTLDQFVTVSYTRELQVAPGITLRFYDAGHILGSSIAFFHVSLGGNTSIDIAFSGDLGRNDKPIIRDPAQIPDVEHLVLESTYGNRLHEPVADLMPRLAAVINESVKRKGKVLIPAFSIGRTQELVFYLHLLTDGGLIPEIPIFVDSPMATNATGIFRVHPECYDEETYDAFLSHYGNPFGFNSLSYIDNVNESKRLNAMKGPAVIIASDGMCEAGRILHHLAHGADDPANTILVAGYMAEGTLGRKILEKPDRIRVMGNDMPLRARVEEIRALSGHADYEELYGFASRLDPRRLRKIFLVHGEENVKKEFSDFLIKRGFPSVEIMKYGERYTLVE